MKILLDTHILLWWLADSPSLSERARRVIGEGQNVIFVSAITLWEIWLKQSLAKLHLPGDFEAKLAQEGFESLPFNAAHAHEAGLLPWHHTDPFDRALVAQARVEGLTLLTADEPVGAYGSFVTVVPGR